LLPSSARKTIPGKDLHGQHGLAALDPIAGPKKGFLHALTINKSAIGRAQISHIAIGRRYFQHAVIARKETVIREAEMGRLASSDQEGCMAVECEDLPGVRSGQHF
jgi:hypothetical protein